MKSFVLFLFLSGAASIAVAQNAEIIDRQIIEINENLSSFSKSVDSTETSITKIWKKGDEIVKVFQQHAFKECILTSTLYFADSRPLKGIETEENEANEGVSHQLTVYVTNHDLKNGEHTYQVMEEGKRSCSDMYCSYDSMFYLDDL
ncbi:hypothetical protein SAMN05192588_2186 [Nonlabens sp. Hel1_33_55]|uniref:hypothetical protein n=1 Tax=Nonlabens sp. Hel1_33_55 TaxID=1336802 RepID=UPI000875E31E|nr:hypothetical protein [Nonlabens sp. Hel1_33_55]SCY31086.1 hypothetical protein SAMN05192588_2186 [Nonlabens sp. Hel1_33_55]